ncbi:MAG: radical SAM protein [Desulfomonilaceae bacterium]|nr:radical SAM protein [Desulfomonilaceae bacterium]
MCAVTGGHLNRHVVLIHPPAISKRYLKTKFMPYGMSVLYSFLREHGVALEQHDFLMEYLFRADEDIDYHNPEKTFSERDFFSFLDGSASSQDLEAFTAKYGNRIRPDAQIYAFSIVAYHQFWASLLLARHLRSINPGSVIVFGGPFITIKPSRSYVMYGQADYWIKGSGEIPLLMLHRMMCGDRRISVEQIPGLVAVDGNRLQEFGVARLPAEQERMPDFHGLALEPYRYNHPVSGTHTLFLPYRVSKGCPSRCSFCTGRLVDRYDHKSVEKIVNEVKALAEKYGTHTFQFADASINGNPGRLAEVCDRLAQEFPEIRWYSYAKVNGFTRELLSKVKNAGCFALFWGVESAYQPTIRLLGKRFDVENLYALIDHSGTVGIKSYIHLIYNTPHESEHDVRALTGLIERYIDSDHVVFLPQRFLLEAHSLMYEHPDRYGLSNIRKVEAGVFEREQFLYDETSGLTSEDVRKRNERHRAMLADHLEWIRYRNMVNGSSGGWISRLPPKLLVRSGKLARRSGLARKVHEGLVGWIQARSPDIREQL